MPLEGALVKVSFIEAELFKSESGAVITSKS